MLRFEHLPGEYKDGLTELPNKKAFKEAIGKALEEMPASVALLKIDLYGFKLVNDEDGHHDGDEYLRTVAAVLDDTLRDDDLYFLARESGDEFSVILYNVTRSDQLAAVRERIRIELDDYGIPISIGGAIHEVGQSAEKLEIVADMNAIRDRKEHKIGQYDEPIMHEALVKIAHLAVELAINPRDLPLMIDLVARGEFPPPPKETTN